jgi:hypothetical protein
MPYDYAECKKRYQEEFSSMSLIPEGMRYLKVRSLIDSEPLTTSSSLRQWLGVREQRFNRHRILSSCVFKCLTIIKSQLLTWMFNCVQHIRRS